MIHEKFCKYLKAIGFSDTYEHQIKPFLRFCEAENIDFRNIAYEDFCNFIIHLQEKEYGKGYINNLIKAVRKFYTFLSDSEDLDPKYLETVRKFKLLKTDTKLHDYITLKELDELIGEALTYIRRIRPIKMKALLYFLFFTGVRRDELINMKRDNIDLEESKAIIKTPTKNKEERYAYYPDKVSQLLSTYFRVENENTNAFNMNRNKLQYLISRLNKLMPKGRSLTIHTFRHSFAMMLADSNVNVKVSQKLMGHKNINSTMVYYNPNAKMIERIYRKNVKVDGADNYSKTENILTINNIEKKDMDNIINKVCKINKKLKKILTKHNRHWLELKPKTLQLVIDIYNKNKKE